MTEEDLWCKSRGCDPGSTAQGAMKSAAKEHNCSYGEQPAFTFPKHGLIQDDGGHQFQTSACRDKALNAVQGRQVSFHNTKDVHLMILVRGSHIRYTTLHTLKHFPFPFRCNLGTYALAICCVLVQHHDLQHTACRKVGY